MTSLVYTAAQVRATIRGAKDHQNYERKTPLAAR